MNILTSSFGEHFEFLPMMPSDVHQQVLDPFLSTLLISMLPNSRSQSREERSYQYIVRCPLVLTQSHHSPTRKINTNVNGLVEREAMWISFNCVRPFAVKVYSNDLNIISGKPNVPAPKKAPLPLMRRLSSSFQGQESSSFQRPMQQDYIVPPRQISIEGIVKLDGIAQQFVATPVNPLDSPGERKIAPVKIKFEITPTRNKNMWVYVDLASESTVPRLRIEANAKDNVRQLIDEMLTKMAIPLRKVLRISFDGDAVGPCRWWSFLYLETC
jgi:hypothetical protein